MDPVIQSMNHAQLLCHKSAFNRAVFLNRFDLCLLYLCRKSHTEIYWGTENMHSNTLPAYPRIISTKVPFIWANHTNENIPFIHASVLC